MHLLAEALEKHWEPFPERTIQLCKGSPTLTMPQEQHPICRMLA